MRGDDIDKRNTSGPFDIIGDIHGCFHELTELLVKLGYSIDQTSDNWKEWSVKHPAGRTVIFLGDLTDRGPDSPSVLKLVMNMVSRGTAYCVAGNHDMKLWKYLHGKVHELKHGLALTAEQLKGESGAFVDEVRAFLNNRSSHYIFDDGKLVVAHAGLKEEFHGKDTGAVRSFTLFGATTGKTDEYGFPIRLDWAADYHGKAKVVYGHTPRLEPVWVNNTINIDTACVFGGKLTALRYPEEELVSVDAKKVYSELIKPLD